MSWNIIEKKNSSLQDLNLSLVSVNRHAMHSTIMHTQEKVASSPELSNTVFSPLQHCLSNHN